MKLWFWNKVAALELLSKHLGLLTPVTSCSPDLAAIAPSSPSNPQLSTPGVGRADVWVFDAGNVGAASLGGSQSPSFIYWMSLSFDQVRSP